jgi:hypothetical protein
MPGQPLSILDHIIQKREADHLFYTNMNEFTVLSNAVFLRIMNVLFIHGRAFPAIVNIRVLEHDEMLAHIFKFTDVNVMRGCIQYHMAISVSEHLTGTCQTLSSTTCIRLFGGRFLFPCHWVFSGLPFSPPMPTADQVRIWDFRHLTKIGNSISSPICALSNKSNPPGQVQSVS